MSGPGGSWSVVMVSYNTKDLLCQGLLSLQTHAPGAEVFVVDNASADGSPEAVADQFPDVTLIQNKKNLGFAKANNQAFAKCSRPLVLLLNSDAELSGEVLTKLEAHFENEKTGAVGAALTYEDGRRQNAIAAFPTLATEFLGRSLLAKLFPDKYPSKYQELQEPLQVDSVIGAALALRKSALDDVGGFDEDYFFFVEETDLCFRLKQKGWTVWHDPTAQVVHKQGASVRKVKARARVEYHLSRNLFFKKHKGVGVQLILRLGIFFKLILDTLGALLLTLLSFGLSAKMRGKLGVYMTLLRFYLLGCPERMGLRGL